MADITRLQLIVAIIVCVYTVPAASDCTVGESVRDRPNYWSGSNIAVLSSKVIPCSGELIEWVYWAGKSGRFRAMVVRPHARNFSRFHIVGINDITVTSDTVNQKSTYSVPKDNRVPVKSGDMIGVGIFSGTNNPQLKAEGKNGVSHITQYVGLEPSTLKAGGTLLTEHISDNYETSIMANIQESFFVDIPEHIVVNTDHGHPTAVVLWPQAQVKDNISGPLTITSNFNPGNRFPLGTTDVVYTAIDASGNEISAMFNITVIDAEPLVIVNIPPAQHMITDPNSATASVWWTPPTASDNSGEAVTLTSNYQPGDNFTISNTTVTYTAVDVYGNLATCVFFVIVIDVETPIIVDTPSSQHVITDPDLTAAAVWWTPPTARDNSGEPVTLTSNYSPAHNFIIGTTTVVYTATDDYGNIATYSFLITLTAGKAVRLVGGANANEGRVEVYYNNTWGTVCDDFFDAYDAKVVCQQLDLPHDEALVYGSARFGQGSGSILLDDIQCNGNESDLGQCSHSGWGETDCSHIEDVGITCAYRIRLVGGASSQKGRVEIHVNGSWGTVCNDSWDANDAQVVCRQLGLPSDGAKAYKSARFGQGLGSILLNNVQCTGNESALSLCSHAGWGVSNCTHHEDTGVICGCPSGYKGDGCQNVTCHPSCYNGGKCMEPNICTCRNGYHGSRCENAMCRPLCSNGGTCTGPNNCTCQPSYHGDRCQYETEPPYTTRELETLNSLQD